ncbi:MAG: CRISPR-associated helicase Cas3' [Caldisericota bacterium]|nr:CRISPR-associated helicase Cas3' [Caldisericota bacterium]
MNNYSEFFEKTTESKPYEFQKRLFKTYLDESNILLKAPTGAGKTWASILPFIYIVGEGGVAPKKLIYSLPLRTLANSLYNEVSQNDIIKKMGLKVSLQTGEFPNDKFLESDIIFTTIDQTLSSILGFPYSLSKRQANINAGAIIGSYLIFDEFHLLDPSRSLTTSLNILKRLKQLSRFCIMTATISNGSVKGVNNFLETDSVILDDDEFNSISNLKNEKNIEVKNRPLYVNDILREHKKKTIVICNTVERTQKLYLELKKETDIDIICIHSRFFKKDRISKEKKIINIFGKDSDPDKEAILISTQVIEVGLDISCDTLHTEISPINSFLQRAGRCARFKNEKGRIFIYDVQENKNGKKSYLPYEKSLCLDTIKELRKENSLDYATGEKIVNAVLSDKEIKEIENAENLDFSRITRAWKENDKSVGRDLIRDVNSVNVVFLRKPNTIHSMYNYDAVSINPHTLESKLKMMAEQYEDEEEPLVSVIEESNIIDDFEITKLMMSEILIADIKLYPRVVLNPEYVNYNAELGLNFLLKGKTTIESSPQETEKKGLFGYKKETYEKHISNMIKIYETNFIDKIYYPLSKLWDKHHFTTDIDEMIKFMMIMHDYGKLNKEWQKIAIDFQKSKGNYNEGEILAHTDFNPTKDKLLEKLPPHSGIGAVVTFAILEDVIQEDNEFNIIAGVLASAIIKHHSTTSHTSIPYVIEDKGIKLVLEMINNYAPSFYKFDSKKKVIRKWNDMENLNNYTIDFSNPDEVFLYFILVRILRLCDQKSIIEED